MVVQTSTGGTFSLSSLPNFAGEPAKLTAEGILLEQNDGTVMMQVGINAVRESVVREGTRQQTLSSINTRIVLPPKQYVVLATAPVGNVTSTFVVQVTGRAKVGGRKVDASLAAQRTQTTNAAQAGWACLCGVFSSVDISASDHESWPPVTPPGSM